MADTVFEADDDERRLYEQLGERPIDELTGVVSASGVRGVQVQAEQQWTLVFTFEAWRVGPDAVQTNKLVVRRKVSDEELKAFQDRIDADTVIKIAARVANDNVFGSPQALMEEFIGNDTADTELHDYLAELQEPVTHSDVFFGQFTLDRSVGDYSTNCQWNDVPVELRLWIDDPDDLEATLKVARVLWDDSTAWDQRIRDCAAKDLLPLKSENWQEEDGSTVTREQFESRMTLESITVHADGSFDVCYNDGELFFGHEIVVYGSIGNGMSSAGIQG